MVKRRKKLVAQQLQEQPYDNVLKSLLEGQEAEMLPCFVPGVEYLEALNIEALRTPLRADRVYKVRHLGQDKIAHFELETSSNSKMTYRLLDYHAYFLHKYDGLPVISIIAYPFRTTVAVSPLREMSGREEVLTFHFRVICFWELDAEDFIRKQVVSMYPFLPTMRGANETLLRQAIDDLTEHYKHDETKLARQLRWFGILLRRADIIPPDDKRRVQERLDMWDDLIEQDPKMKQIRAESAAKGMAEGRAEGLSIGKAEGLFIGKAEGLVEGEIKGLQNAVVKIVRGRFPSLAELAEHKVAELYEPPILYYLVEQISVAPDESMVRFLLRPSAA